MWYLSPRPPEDAAISLYQEESYYDARHASGYSDYRAQEEPLRLTFRALLRRLERAEMTGGALLEVGCAHGFLLDEAAPYFARRVGVDLSREALEQAARVADRAYLGGLEQVDESGFDLVIAVQVIEHVYAPADFVRRAVDKLKPGGWLILATPDMDSPWRWLFGKRWPSFKIPEHVVYYDRRTLGRLLSEADLVNVRSVPYPHAFPWPLVLAKLGLRAPQGLAERAIWVPWTTFALAARKPQQHETLNQTSM